MDLIDHEVLARHLVTLPGWRWMPRMVDTEGRIPDLTDAGTLGCLLALVREAWGNPGIYVALDPDEGWDVCALHDGEYQTVFGSGATEAHALVAALEARAVFESAHLLACYPSRKVLFRGDS